VSSHKTRQLGEYVSVYLSQPLHEYATQKALESGTGMGALLRDTFLEAAPDGVKAAHNATRRSGGRLLATTPNVAPDEAGFEEMVADHRERILELAGRGFKQNAICAVLHVPYKVVQQVLTTKKKTAKGGKKK